MTIRGDESSLFSSASIVLWVEDELTRSYLYAVWEDDASLAIRIAGSKNAARGIVADACRGGNSNVFGLVDRDFQSSNQAAWADLTNSMAVFVLPVFEIENYLLDPRALAGCALNTHNREDSHIKMRLRDVARRIAWWTVCCNVISELREDFFADFPEHPTIPAIGRLEQAVDYIAGSIWREKLAGNAARWTDELVRERLIAINTRIQAQLNSGDDWRFFRKLRTYLEKKRGHADPIRS